MDTIGVRAVAGGRNGKIVHRDSDAIVELQVALRAVLDRDPGHRYVEATVESNRLH